MRTPPLVAGLALSCLASGTTWAQKSATDSIAEYRAMLQDGNPAELFEAKGEDLWKKARGPKNASLEKCDLGQGPGVVKGAFVALPKYFADTQRVKFRHNLLRGLKGGGGDIVNGNDEAAARQGGGVVDALRGGCWFVEVCFHGSLKKMRRAAGAVRLTPRSMAVYFFGRRRRNKSVIPMIAAQVSEKSSP